MKDSKISWTHHTFNIAWGCSKVSPGCKNCYADTLSAKFGNDVWGADKPRKILGAKYWGEPVKWNNAASASGERQRVFCSSMCDVFETHPTIDAERAKLWELIRQTPWLDWLLLTKRAERIAANLPADWQNGYPNVWLGVSVENEDYVSRFNQHLATIPAVVRFVSYEPALGAVTGLNWSALDWLIYGGESGEGYRSNNIEWARQAKALCDANGVNFFFKQGNGLKPGTNESELGSIVQNFPGKATR